MDNQHKRIKGYRDLSQAEIDLMNRIKETGAKLLELQREVASALKARGENLIEAARQVDDPQDPDGHMAALDQFTSAEPHRWAAIAKTDIQTGLMALIRAVAQPTV
jgi:hypothetical protein